MTKKTKKTTKTAALSASLEDYLEAIFNLTGRTGAARSRDIAAILGVSRASVTGAVRSLKDKGLVNYKPYDYVRLTDTGRSAAAEVVKKHNILKAFLIDVLGIDAGIAQQAACKAEHTLGPEVAGRLLCFIEFVTGNSKGGCDLAKQFERFYKTRSKSKTKPNRKQGI